MIKPTPAVELSQKVGKYIKQARKHFHVTQQEVCQRAARCGFYLSISILSKIENGCKYVTIYDLLIISQALGISADAILKGEWNDKSTAN